MPIDMSRSRPRVVRTRPLPTIPKVVSPPVAKSAPLAAPLIITDYIIVALSKNPLITKEFPTFNITVPQVMKRGCGKCGKNAPMVMRQEPNALLREVARIRNDLLSMDQASRVRLKALLNKDVVEIHIPHPKGGSRQVF